MRQNAQFTLAAALIGLAAAACGEGTAPASGQADVLAAETDQLGAMVDTDFGAAGAAATAAPTTSSSGVLAAPTATAGDTAPTFWGRLRVVPGGPRPVYHRDVTIQGDTARVEHDVTFQGVFLVDTSADGLFNPTAKPLADRMTQRAVLVRDRSEAADGVPSSSRRRIGPWWMRAGRRSRSPTSGFIATTRCSSRSPIPAPCST